MVTIEYLVVVLLVSISREISRSREDLTLQSDMFRSLLALSNPKINCPLSTEIG